jgi:hypothetical protein
MANQVATIIAVCVLAFYLILTTALSVCWCIQRRKHKRTLTSLEPQVESSAEGTTNQRTVDCQQSPSRTASMYSETRSVSSMFHDGRGRVPYGSNRSSVISYADRRYSSVNSLLIPLQPVHSVEDDATDDRLSIKTGRSRASSTSTLRYYALPTSQEEEIPAVPRIVPAPS